MLDASCNVDFENCRAVMDGFAIRLEEDAVCGDHLERRQPQVLRAYNGLLAYPQVYNTGCLENSDGEYCKFCKRRENLAILPNTCNP